MAFVIQIQDNDGTPHYWIGGDICSEYGEDAVRFMSETDAEATIDVLRKAIGLSDTARVIDLGDVIT